MTGFCETCGNTACICCPTCRRPDCACRPAAEPAADRLAEIRKRADAATPGPWTTWPDGTEESVESAALGRFVCHLNSNMRNYREDSAFIAHAREDIPWLLDQLAARDAEIARLGAAVEYWTGEYEAVVGRVDLVDPFVLLTRERDEARAELAALREACIREDSYGVCCSLCLGGGLEREFIDHDDDCILAAATPAPAQEGDK